MSEYDPFGGRFPQDSEKPKSNFKIDEKTVALIKKVIIFIVVLGVVGGFVYYFFFNNLIINFDVKDTEGKILNSAKIKITPENSNKFAIYYPGEDIKLNKTKTYKYAIEYLDYAKKSGILDPKAIETTITIKLEKEIKLDITSFNCPSPVFIGQKVKCELQLENQSPNEDYNLENIIFRNGLNGPMTWPDLNNEVLVFKDGFGTDLTKTKVIPRKTKDTIFVYFTVPTTITAKNQKIMARVKYTDNNKIQDLNIALAPNIGFSSQLSGPITLESGTEVTKTYTIDNSKNKTEISDLKLTIDANYVPTDSGVVYDFGVNEIIESDYYNISVDASKNVQGLITINLPPNLRAGKIIGVLSLNSEIFTEPKETSFTITVTEPENKFEISLNKNTETLDYNADTKTTNTKQVTLNLNNKNKIPVRVNSITIENSTGTTDCNHWIILPAEYNNYDIQSNYNPAPTILLQGSDLSSLTTVTGLKICNINVDYKHPFTDENIIIRNKIQISVN